MHAPINKRPAEGRSSGISRLKPRLRDGAAWMILPAIAMIAPLGVTLNPARAAVTINSAVPGPLAFSTYSPETQFFLTSTGSVTTASGTALTGDVQNAYLNNDGNIDGGTVTCPALFVPSELIEIGLERSLDMPKKRPTPEQIVTLLRQIEVATSQGKSIAIACREAGISDQSYYRWRKEYGGLDLDQARRMKDLEKENGRLKRLVADLSLEKQVLKDIASGNL